MSDRLRGLFALGAMLMIAHKTESLFTEEYLVDPAYAAIGAWLTDPKHVMIALIGLLGASYALVLASARGGRAVLVVCAIAGVVFTHEIHHAVRSALAASYYPGTATGTIVFLFSLVYWPELLRCWRASTPSPAVESLPA